MTINSSGKVTVGGVLGESINLELGKAETATTALNDADARALAEIAAGQISFTDFYGKYSYPVTTKGIFGYGLTLNTLRSMTNRVSDVGVVATDTTGVGTARGNLAATGFGTGRVIFGYGQSGPSTTTAITNLVSDTGVVSGDTAGVGQARCQLAACRFGADKGIFAYGRTAASTQTAFTATNMVSSIGVVSTDVAGLGTAKSSLAGCGYGGDKGIFAYGGTLSGGLITARSTSSLVTNTGVCGADVTGVGTARYDVAACGYGGDKGIFGYGVSSSTLSMTNKVSNTGVVAADTAGVGTVRSNPGACGYGSDKGIFGYGQNGSTSYSLTNLVSNLGVVSSNVTGVGTARERLGAAGYSSA